jgi:uncharacterized repeat protein (TIGR03803 family)
MSKLQATIFAIALILALALTIIASPAAQAQTFQVIHDFTGNGDGSEPNYGITIDSAGNLYGTTFYGSTNTGTVYKLTHKSSSWVLTPLYTFIYEGSGGSIPYATVIIGANGSLYGTAAFGGNLSSCVEGCGTVYNLKPPATFPPTPLFPWSETPIYRFSGSDGANPYGGDILFDKAGNLYGATYLGGSANCPSGCGVVYKLTPSGGGWSESVLYSFTNQGGDGANPWAGVVFDQSGNLFGTTVHGGAYGGGTVYELSPSGGGWTEKVLYSFTGGADGGSPYAGLTFDQAGNLYGATVAGGTGKGGTAFQLTPSQGSWTLNTLYSFAGNKGSLTGGPFGKLILDSAGNLYGATSGDGIYGVGSAFKLSPGSGGWTYTSLHDFTGGLDGGNPRSYLVFDKNGNLFGTAAVGGTGNVQQCAGACGVVFEITP